MHGADALGGAMQQVATVRVGSYKFGHHAWVPGTHTELTGGVDY